MLRGKCFPGYEDECLAREGEKVFFIVLGIFGIIGLVAISLTGCTMLHVGIPSTTEPMGGSPIEKSCMDEFTDPNEVAICVVTHKVNQGLTINGRMTAHETAIEHLNGRILALEAKCNQTSVDHNSAPLLK